MIKRHFFFVCICFGLIAYSSVAQASQITWVASSPNNDMNDSANWNPNTIPGSSDDAIFKSTIPNIDTNPTINAAPFSVSTFNFPFNASIFNFSFNNETLTFNGAGVTGSNTNPTITVTNINNSSFPGDLVSFIGGTGTSGSSIITSSNNGTLTGSHSGTSIGSINSNLHSIGAFTIANNGNITASNTGNDSANGTGNNGASNTGASQLKFDQSFSAGDNVTISASNSGTFSGTNTVQGDAVAIINGSQFISSGAFQVGDNFNCEVENTGNDSSLGVGLSNIGQLNAAQMILQTTGAVGNNCRINVSNTGINSSQTTNFPDFIGYLNDQQFFAGSTFQAGNNFSLTASNIGTDTSNGYGNCQVAVINSNSGTTGTQVLFKEGSILGDHATISATNSGTYSGTNTNGGSNVAGMNLQQIAVGDSTAPGSYAFTAGDYFSLNASNSGIDSSNGTGGDAVGTVSTDQIAFFTPVTLGTQANITITNSGNFSGNASATYVNVGSAGGSQLNCVSSVSAGDNFTLSVSNSGTNTGSGVGGYFIGDLIGGQQVTFQNSLIIGNNASMTISNSGSKSSNTTSNNQVGSLMGYGKQLLAKNLFQIGDDFFLEITNSGFDDSTGSGGNFVGFINNNTVDSSASQFHLGYGGTIGDRATITLSNTGTYQGSNTTSGNSIGTLAGQQLYSVSDFHAGNNLVLTVSNSGIDHASGQNNNSMGTVGSSQVEFGGACVLGNNASIVLSNSGTNNDSTGTFNNIGVVNGSQMSVNGNFTGGTNLTISASNKMINEGNPNNFVGNLSASQLVFAQSCTLNEGSIISAFNSGTVGNSQIVFGQGFNIASGSVTIQAVNQGTVGLFGIDIQGSNAGGNANIVLGNSSLNIGTTLPTFTIAGLIGDSTSIVQSQPQLIINTDSSTQTEFSGVIQNYPATSSTLMKTGTGTQKLSGVNTYTGLTTVQEGILIVNGSLAGDVNIDANGILKGTGSVAGNVINLGTIAPGESIGTLRFLSNFINNGGTYNVEVSGTGASDLIQVTGDAILNGGFVIAGSVDGTYKFQNTYTVVETTGTRSGFFTGATAISSMVEPILTYDDQHVYLTLLTNIHNAAKTSNQLSIATLLDGIVGPNAQQNLLLSGIVGLPNEQAREALDSLSGYQHAADLVTAQLINRQFIRRLFDPIRSIVTTEPDCYCDPIENCCSGLSSWFDVGGTFFNVKGSYETPGLCSYGYNFTLGAQATVCQSMILGVAGSFEQDNIHFNHSNGNEKSNTWLAGLYGLYRPSCFYALVDFVYGNSSNHLKRSIHIGSLDYHAKSNPDIHQFAFYGEGGFDINVCNTLLQPFVGIEVCDYRRKHVNESFANGLGLDVKKRHHALTTTRLGFHLTANDFIQCGASLSLDMAWNYLASNNKNEVHERFQEFGAPFTIKWTKLNHNSIDYAVTYSTPICDNLQAYLEGVGESWEKATIFTVLAGIQYSW